MSLRENPLLTRQSCEVCGREKQILTCDKCGATICNRAACRSVYEISTRVKTYYCKPCENAVLDKFAEYYSSDSDWESEEELEGG